MNKRRHAHGVYQGRLPAEDKATISTFDRGFLFTDAVYEFASVVDGKLLGFDGHCERLKRSVKELDITIEIDNKEILDIHRQLSPPPFNP